MDAYVNPPDPADRNASARFTSADGDDWRSRFPMAVAWHGCTWLLISNCVGLLLATLLLFPSLNGLLGEWTYGHWVPVHLNLNLYGWCSLPLVGWLFRVYRVDQAPGREWSRTTLWIWSAALTVGAFSWLNAHSSGKLFLDWQGYARLVLAIALAALWSLLAWSMRHHWRTEIQNGRTTTAMKLAGLACLFFVPFALYWSADPGVYPPINPDTGGPTGASLLESTLGIILILLILPYGLNRSTRPNRRIRITAWLLFAVEIILSVALGHGNDSHHLPSQIMGLGALLLWVPMIPAYYGAFDWRDDTRTWRLAFFFWWGLLVVSAWLVFLPGLLDRFKFTDALVGHSHMAMAGFVSSLNMFVLVNLYAADRHRFNARPAFLAWQIGTLGYVICMFAAGWIEGANPEFTIVPGTTRNVIYALRLACGGFMTFANLYWWLGLSTERRRQPRVKLLEPSEKPLPIQTSESVHAA